MCAWASLCLCMYTYIHTCAVMKRSMWTCHSSCILICIHIYIYMQLWKEACGHVISGTWWGMRSSVTFSLSGQKRKVQYVHCASFSVHMCVCACMCGGGVQQCRCQPIWSKAQGIICALCFFLCTHVCVCVHVCVVGGVQQCRCQPIWSKVQGTVCVYKHVLCLFLYAYICICMRVCVCVCVSWMAVGGECATVCLSACLMPDLFNVCILVCSSSNSM
jgi:hypothetical protein